MATISRQPFAPLDEARLQNLTSIKNRQNAFTPASSAKRKASDLVGSDDFENVDPVTSSKRSKGADSFFSFKDTFKPSAAFVLTKAAAPLAETASAPSFASPTKPTLPRPRSVLQPKSPAAKINAGISKSSPLYTPAGRSPTRGKRSGILSSRRRTAGPYTRVDPPLFGLSSASSAAAAPFSLDAALKGTIPSYAARSSVASRNNPIKELHEPEIKASWFFDIHEDTPEQEMTNMLQHGTCVLDISSDEESERKASRDRAEGRDKENVPPADDASQTSSRRSARRAASEDDMVFEKERTALGEMDASEFYALGCDETSVILVPCDEEEEEGAKEHHEATVQPAVAPESKDLSPTVEPLEPPAESKHVDDLMGKSAGPATKAAVLEPIEGTGESFELWESGSAKDETEVGVADRS